MACRQLRVGGAMASHHDRRVVDALGGTITEPAWRTKPSWYLLTTEDKMIPPARPTFHVGAGWSHDD